MVKIISVLSFWGMKSEVPSIQTPHEGRSAWTIPIFVDCLRVNRPDTNYKIVLKYFKHISMVSCSPCYLDSKDYE